MQIVLSSKLSEIFKLVAAGESNEEISKKMGYSLSSIEKKIKKLKTLYNVKNKVQLANEYTAEKMSNY